MGGIFEVDVNAMLSKVPVEWLVDVLEVCQERYPATSRVFQRKVGQVRGKSSSLIGALTHTPTWGARTQL